jgi:hypothetical protein
LYAAWKDSGTGENLHQRLGIEVSTFTQDWTRFIFIALFTTLHISTKIKKTKKECYEDGETRGCR